MAKISVISVQIPPNETSSSTADLGSHALVAIEMPEEFNGTTITFQSKAKWTEDVTAGPAFEDLDDVYDSGGNQITWTVAAGRVVVPTAAHAAAFAPLRYLRVVAGTGQGSARELRLIVKEGN